MKPMLIGLGLGTFVGFLDVALFMAMGQKVTALDASGAISFWSIAGLVIHNTKLDINPIMKGGIIGLLLMIPWIIEYVGVQGKSDFFVVLVIISITFGSLIGFLSAQIIKRQSHVLA